MELLKKLSKDKLIIVVSHDEELAQRYADRIIRLVDGVVDSDVTFTESKIDSNISENDRTLLVRAGCDLSEKEKDTVAKAIKQSKKIELINNLSHRKVVPTDEGKIRKATGSVELTRSKMKIKSSISLGLKSLIVKPARLVFTIILCVVAFAVFGLFDTVANFSTAKVINNLLRTSASTVATYGQYVIDGAKGDVYDVKLSEGKLQTISNETGLKVKGIYDFKDNDSGYVRPSYVIQELGGYSESVGKDYYSRIITGFMEINDNEFSGDGLSIPSLGFRIIEGRYPDLVYDTDENGNLYVTPESLYETAVSSYMADSIVHLLTSGGSVIGDLNGKSITTRSDLIGASLTVNAVRYTIVGIIDCGALPKKYDPLKTQITSTGEMQLLAEDFSSYVSAGAYQCLFMASGHRREVLSINNEPEVFFGGKASWTVSIPGSGYSRRASSYVYSSNGYYNDDAVFFYGERTYGKKLELNDDEVLIHAANVRILFESEISALENENKTQAQSLAQSLADTSLTAGERKLNLEQLMTILELSEQADREKAITLSRQSTTTTKQTVKRIKVVGFYIDIDLNNVPSSTEFRFMMNDNLMGQFDIYTDQGEYSRFIVNPTGNLHGTQVISKYMLAEEGLSLVWYGNFALHTIQSNEAVIRKGADLFLYISLALAVFSVFMLFNYIVTSIVNKLSTIGVLRGLGSGGRDILRIFLSESIIISLVNGILATLLTLLGCVFVNNYIMNVMNIAIPFALFGIRQIGIIFGLSIATAVLSSTIPIIKIAKQKPVELIRTV